MHRKNVLHRDIKADNILYKENGEVKIGDLGLSIFLNKELTSTKSIRGNFKIRSPEMYKLQEYGAETDIWSLGCFAY